MPWSHSRAKEDVDPRRNTGLPADVVSKIQQVGNQRSSLTPSGSHGLTSRVLERAEYPQHLSDGKVEYFVCQTTELIKRPGQTLGIYIREGNGIDRTDGVFISRLHENGEAANSGLLKVGDEIISINSVDVSQMPVDDVVVAMSIPTRLILRTRFPKNRKGPMASNESKGPLFKLKSTSSFYQPDNPFEESMEDNRIESQSAMTSLGARAAAGSRYAPLTSSASEHTPLLSHQRSSTVPKDRAQCSTQPSTSYQNVHSHTSEPISRSRTHYFESPHAARRFANIRSLNSASQLSRAARRPHYDYSSGPELGAYSDTEPSSLTATAHVPPPKLYPVTSPQALIRRANSMRTYVDPRNPLSSLAQFASDANPFGAARRTLADISPRFPHRFTRPLEESIPIVRARPQARYPPALQRIYDADEGGNTSSDSEAAMASFRSADGRVYPAHLALWGDDSRHLKPALREPAMFPGPGHSSNSLPKRRGGRVKWRNDVKGGRNSALGHRGHHYDYGTDSDGAVSAPELSGSPTLNTLRRFGDRHRLRTIDDIFTSEEYQTWRQPGYGNALHYQRGRSRDPRRGMPPGRLTNSAENLHAQKLYSTPHGQLALSAYEYGGLPPLHEQSAFGAIETGERHRSSSLPPKRLLQGVTGEDYPRLSHFSPPSLRDRPPFMRSNPYRHSADSWPEAGPSIGRPYRVPPSPEPSAGRHPRTRPASSISGILILFVLEGRGLKVPERRTDASDELYCVLEIDGEHRARTSISTYENRYMWNEAFEIDVCGRRQADFFIYSWHTKYKHKLCHRGSLKLDESYLKRHREGHLISLTDDVGQKFALTLEPRGQLLVRMAYRDLSQTFKRMMTLRKAAYFGVDLITLVDRESTGIEVPVLFRRLIEEIERRGVDCNGVYALCGSALKKQELRNTLEKNPLLANISGDAVPDINVITGVLKDFLRELPEPLIVPSIYQMLWEAVGVCLPEDKEGSVRLVLGVIDCLPRLNKCTLMILMDHLKYVCSHVAQNSMTAARLCTVFGPLLLCSANPSTPSSADLNVADPGVAIKVFNVLFDLWPTRNWSSESSSSDSCTMNMTQHGERSLVEVWLEERKDRESKC